MRKVVLTGAFAWAAVIAAVAYAVRDAPRPGEGVDVAADRDSIVETLAADVRRALDGSDDAPAVAAAPRDASDGWVPASGIAVDAPAAADAD